MANKNSAQGAGAKSAKTRKKGPQLGALPHLEESRRGGLGRGLGALIPSGPQRPRLSDSAADAVLGGGSRSGTGSGTASGARGGGAGVAPGLGAGAGVGAGRGPLDAPSARGAVPGAPTAAVTGVPAPVGGGVASASAGVVAGATYVEIPIGDIEPNPDQPRTSFEEEPLEELAHSIREFGLLQPIVVRVNPRQQGRGGKNAATYELIMGERRWRAAAKAGLKEIPAIVRATEDSAMLRDALLENIHRVQLNPLEEAAAYQQLLDEFGVTQEELAKRLGRSRPAITNAIRLLGLPVAVQRRVAAGVLTAGHARALAGVKVDDTAGAQTMLAERIVAEGLSVRATEEAVTLLNKGEAPAERKPRVPVPQPELFTRTAERLADVWDTKVTVTMGKRKGKMVIEFGDEDDFQRIMEIIDGSAGT